MRTGETAVAAGSGRAAIHTPQGEALVPGRLLGRGGEARVYALEGDSRRALKIYEAPARERGRKLAAMLANVPEDADRNIGHVSIAWPEELALNPDGELVGFVMPRIDSEKNLPLHQLYNPGSRRTRAPGISWRYLVRIGRNLSSTLAALHEAGYVMGDLNESNILVNDRALVSLVDLDSIQVKTTMHVFRCNVGKVEYTPPELQTKSFRNTTRSPSSDRFGLAVLIFLLLMEGNHPFSAIHTGTGDPPGLAENIRARRSPYFGGRGVRPSPSAPPAQLLPPSLRALLAKALTGPAWRRPNARALASELAALEDLLVHCARVPSHAYPGTLSACPWCARRQSLGRDPYPPKSAGAVDWSPATLRPSSPPSPPARAHTQPAPAASAQRASPPAPSTTPPPTPLARPAEDEIRHRPGPAGFRGTLAQFQRRLVALTVALLLASALPIVVWSTELQLLLDELGAAWPLQAALATTAALLPALAVSLFLYARSRRSPSFARRVLSAERLLRAAVIAALISLAAYLVAGSLGDLVTAISLPARRALLTALWLLTTALLYRILGPSRF